VSSTQDVRTTGNPIMDPSAVEPRRPGSPLWRATVALTKAELRNFFRNKMQLTFVLLFPILLLVVFASLFSGNLEVGGETIPLKQLMMAGIIAAGVMSTGFQGVAIDIVLERDKGMIRRFATAPMPRAAYFIAKIVRVLVTTFVEVAILLAISVFVYDLPLPGTAARWLTFGWVILLGTFACTLMGMAWAGVIPSGPAATPMTTPIFLVLQFMSGVFLALSDTPKWMLFVAELFPLKWMAQGLRSVFLPDVMKYAEPRNSWELATGAIVMGAWVIFGAFVTWRTFKWRGPKVI
jgi:ABC-2 type transport system permease protein